MSFNEQNSVENFIIHHLTGVNLNAIHGGVVREDAPAYGTEPRWKYLDPDLLVRDISNVMLVCPKCKKNTRVGIKITDNKKVRVCKKCNGEI